MRRGGVSVRELALARLLFSESTSYWDFKARSDKSRISGDRRVCGELALCALYNRHLHSSESIDILVCRYTSRTEPPPTGRPSLPCNISRDLGTVRRKLIEGAL